MAAVSASEADLRAEFIDGAVKAVALMEYKLKTLCTISSSSAWTETYFRETNTELIGMGTAATGQSTVRGIPRFAPFPYGEVTETKVQALIEKYGMEGKISYEDELLENVPMVQRTILRIGRAVSYAIDVQIAATMLSAGNTFAITAGNEWDSATIANRDPIFDILAGIQMLRADNINALNGNGYLCLNGTDYTNIISNSKIVNHPTFKTVSAVENGVVGELCGLKIMVTEALEATTPDVAYIVVGLEAMTWKEAVPLKVEQIVDAGISRTIRAFELGVCQLTSPNAICKITNTRK